MQNFRFLTSISVLLLFTSLAYAQPSGKGFVEATEEDLSPSCFGYQLKFANGNVTDNGDGTCSVADQSGGGAPTDATYITQTSNATLSAEQALDALSSGIMRVDTAAGVITSLTDSSGIADNVSDETGSGALMFGTAPTITTSLSFNAATDTVAGIQNQNLLDKTATETITRGWVIDGTANEPQLRIQAHSTNDNVIVVEESDSTPIWTNNLNTFRIAVTTDLAGTVQFSSLQNCDTIDSDGSGVLSCGADAGAAEVNNLETITTGIATTEIPIGTAVDTAVYAALSGDVTMDNAGVVTISANSIDDSMLNTTDHITLYSQSSKLTGSFITAGGGIDAGDPLWRGLFDAGSTESMLWQFTAPTGCCASAVAKITYSMASATSGSVDVEIEIMAVADGESMTSASFDTLNEISGGTDVPGTADLRDTISLTLTNFDSGAAGETIVVRFNRDHDDGDDDATGDLQLHELNIEWTR